MASQHPTPQKVVTYPIAAEPNAGALFLFGSVDSPNIALLCAGYPDDHENFLPFASRLANEAKCLVGVTCLPGYDDREDFPYTRHKNRGYSFDEMAGAMREAVKVLRRESTFKGNKGGAKLTGVFHDWGVAPGSMYCNRSLEEEKNEEGPDQIVLFDVLGPPHPETKDMPIAPKDSLYDTVVTLTYRIVLATSFGIRRYISKVLAQIYAGFAFKGLGLFRLSPTFDIDAKVMQERQSPIAFDRMLYMAYPYFNMFKAMFTGKMKEEFYGMSLPKDLEKTPVLYMYGTNKRIMFHDKRALMVLEREAKEGRRSKAIAVEGAGHWLYLHEPDFCLEEVVKFVTDA